jgi:hypothetical protein
VAVHANETLIVQLVHKPLQPAFTRAYPAAVRGQPNGVPLGLSDDYLPGLQNDQPAALNRCHPLRQPAW